MNRRRFLYTAAAPIAAAVLPSCGGSGNSSAAAVTPPGSSPPPNAPAPTPMPTPGFGTISAISVEFEDPTNAALTTHNMFEDLKHEALVQNFVSGYHDPGDVNLKLYLMGGDFMGWPSGQRNDYPTTPYWSYDGRQDAWYADVSTNALNSGKLRFKLAQNYYHNYPWDGTGGYFGPGRPGGGAEPQKGPLQPDAIGLTVDKRGQIWHGPSYSKYDQNRGMEAGGVDLLYPAMWKWSMPDLHPTTRVRLGGSGDGTKGWTLPSQNRLQLFNIGQTASDWDVPNPPEQSVSFARPNNTAYDPAGDKLYLVGVTPSATQLSITTYSMSLDPTVVAGQGGQYQWVRSSAATISLARLGLVSASPTDTPNDDMHNGDICSIAFVNGSLYFPFTCSFNVPAGYGNATSTYLRKAWLLKVTPGATQASAPTIDWIPFPQVQNWWLRGWDGPQSAEWYAAEPADFGTTGQYRTLKGLGNKVVLGPDIAHHVTKDPWICVYDTQRNVWTTFDPPASHSITNGGHDWPMSTFGFHPVPSLGECWLFGCPQDDWTANFAPIVNNGLHNRVAYQASSGLKIGRRIIRFKVV